MTHSIPFLSSSHFLSLIDSFILVVHSFSPFLCRSFSYFLTPYSLLTCTHTGMPVASGDCKCIHITNIPMCAFHRMFDPNITSTHPLLVSSRNSTEPRAFFWFLPLFIDINASREWTQEEGTSEIPDKSNQGMPQF